MATIDLLFSQTPVTGQPVSLVFGAAADVVVVAVEFTLDGQLPKPALHGVILGGPVMQISMAGTLAQPPLTAAFDLRYVAAISLYGLLPDTPLTAAFDAQYLTNTARPTVGQVAAVAQVARQIESGLQHFEQQTTRTNAGVQAGFTDAIGVDDSTWVAFEEAHRTQQGRATAFQDAARLDAVRAHTKWQDGLRDRREQRTGTFQDGMRAPTSRIHGRFQEGVRDRRTPVSNRSQAAVPRSLGYQGHAGAAVPKRLDRLSKFQEGRRPPAGIAAVIVVPPVVTYRPGSDLVFFDATNGTLIFIRDDYVEPATPGATLYILPARFYMTTHNVFAQRLPDLADIPIYDPVVAADEGSYCWTLQASGPSSLFELLASVDGLPVQLRVTMDGIPWVFSIDTMKRSQVFGKTGVSITGRSVTALIGAPYLRAITRDNTGGSMLAQQLALSALQYTGVDLDWGLTDWMVPAGAWSHQGTPLDAVQAIAQAAGGYLQSHRSEPTLLTRHPYSQRAGDNPGAPWGWMTGPADVELAPDAIITDGTERKDGPDINAIYVSGTTQGVLGLVKRTGTAGDKLAAMVTDALITDAIAARQRGLSVLGSAGSKYNVVLELPVLTGLGQPGVLNVGQLVQINAATPWRGRVRAVSVASKRPTLRQTVTLERHLEIA